MKCSPQGNYVGHGGSVVSKVPCIQRVAGANPALVDEPYRPKKKGPGLNGIENMESCGRPNEILDQTDHVETD